MIYNPGTPKAKDIFSSSQEPFLVNFKSLFDAFGVNHVPLNSVSNLGNHTIIQMPEQPSSSQFQTDVGEISIYCKDPLNSNNVTYQTDQVYLRYQGNQEEFQYTTYQIYPLFEQTTPLPENQPYFSFLPNNIIVYFGILKFNSSSTTFNFKPSIVKNIISANFNWIGVNPGLSPTYNLIQKTIDKNVYYTGLTLHANSTSRPNPPLNLSYIILAGI